MNTARALAGTVDRRWPGLLQELPTLAEAAASLLRTVIVAMFVLTFIMDPCMIPSPSMESTLMVGDFLLSNRQVFAPEGTLGRLLLPYRDVRRGDVVVFYHADPSLLVKRVVAVPGDRIRIVDGHVFIDGEALNEPYAQYSPVSRTAIGIGFPPPEGAYDDPEVDPHWWRQMQGLDHDGELTVPSGDYFVLGDNRGHSEDSRFWGFVPRDAIFARPLVIYFSLRKSSSPEVQMQGDDRLGMKKDFSATLTGFARWKRIFRVVH